MPKPSFAEDIWAAYLNATASEAVQEVDPDLLLADGCRPDQLVATAHDPAYLRAVRALRPDALMQKPIDLATMCRACGY